MMETVIFFVAISLILIGFFGIATIVARILGRMGK